MKKLVAFLLCIFMLVPFVSCGKREADDLTVRVITLKGPTGMGMAELMQRSSTGETENTYEFTLASTPDEVASAISRVDIAALPVNLAAALFNKGEKIRFAAINTLGVLSILENGTRIQSVADLKGKTIYATGQGSTPEYILTHLLKANGIDPEKDVVIEYLSEHAALATKLASGDAAIGVLPEPNVSSALIGAKASGNDQLRIALDVTKEWEKLGEGTLAQGCIVVSEAFAKEHPKALRKFMEEYKESVLFVNTKQSEAAEMIASFGIVPKAQIAERAIDNCKICCLDGKDGIDNMKAMLAILYAENPKSVGGKLPSENFYEN